MRPSLSTAIVAGAIALSSGLSANVLAQSSILRVVGTDSLPIPFASVFVQGGVANITDEHGRLPLIGKHQTLTTEVRRIGYTPWFGKIELPDTAATITIVLARIAQQLGGVTITGEQTTSRLAAAGFYDRWQQRQKGALSATFIGPEELERRHPQRISDMLSGVSGVSMIHTPQGGMVAKGVGGTCFMTILVDGAKVCPPLGCHTAATTGQNAPQITPARPNPGETLDDIAVDLNRYVTASDVTAIEVYARGGNMPASLQVSDNACGAIAIWTGSRH